MKNPTPAPQTDPHTKRASRDSIRTAPGVAIRSVRWAPCPICRAAAGAPCRRGPRPGDHLDRWLDAYAAGRVSLGQLAAEIGRLDVITRATIVPERTP